MPFSPKTIEEKPYNMCLNCRHIGKTCDGPNFLAMTMERWVEWCRLRKDYLGLTNATIAERADVAKISVDRALSGASKDVRISTMSAITRVLVNGTWGQYPCAMAADAESDAPALKSRNEELEAQLRVVRAEDQRKIDFLKEQVKFKEEQMIAKDNLLNERRDFLKLKDRAIGILTAALIFSILVILALVLADLLNPDLGFFWRA